jgi:hypothetical protein
VLSFTSWVSDESIITGSELISSIDELVGVILRKVRNYLD